MKIIILLLSTILFSLQNITGQSSTNKLSSTLGEDKLLTLPEIQKSFNDYWAPYNVKDGYYTENG